MNILNVYGCPHSDPAFANLDGFYASLECEIEDLANLYGNGKTVGQFTCKEDHSLRNNGWEYISKQPLPRTGLVHAFKHLHSLLKFKGDDDPFHERTSTHVHVNCMSLEPQQVKNIVLLYAMFEDFYFSMAKPNRKNNIHCVALTDTYMPAVYKKDMEALLANWHKYTALNMCRLSDLGTLEFRHLHGTGNAEELNQWLSAIEGVWTLGQQVVLDKATLSDKALIRKWFQTIFKDVPAVLKLEPSLFDIIRNSLIDVKMSTL